MSAGSPVRIRLAVGMGVWLGVLTYLSWFVLTRQWHLAVAVPGFIVGVLIYWRPAVVEHRRRVRTTGATEGGTHNRM